MDEEGVRLPVIAKVEKPQAVDNLEEVVRAFDGIMVARGDLGVERRSSRCRWCRSARSSLARRNAKPVIVATQVLESMIENSRPTRAEASDAANAVLDGADALMLSGETSVGKHVVHTVETMARIIQNTEEHGLERIVPLGTSPRTKGGAITLAATTVGEQARRRRARGLHAGRRLGAAHVAAAVEDPPAGVHPRARRALAGGAVVGRRDLPDAHGEAHRRDGAPGRPGDARRPPPRARRRRGRRGRLAARDPRLDERAARAPAG
nr:pyruvate kinase [Angustibacter aerolatus]